MKIIIGGAFAALTISLSTAAWSQGPVNDRDDQLGFIVRDAEIRAAKPAAGGGEASAEFASITADTAAAAPARSAARSRTTARRPLAAPAGSEGLRSLVARHASANGVPFSLADAVVRVESRYNPRASSRGNYGLMQIRHQTARGLGYSGSAAGLLDAETNVRYAMKYLAQAHRLAGGDTCRTVMKYQSGHMAQRMNAANRAYCAKVRTITASN